jgi:hypothetical protein
LLQRQASLLQRQVSLLQVEGEAGHELTLHNISHSHRQLREFCLTLDELLNEPMLLKISLYRCQWHRRMNNPPVTLTVKKYNTLRYHFKTSKEFLINIETR